MAATATQSPPSLSKDYLLPSEEKPVLLKPVEVTEEAEPVSEVSEETAPQKTEEPLSVAASEESSEIPATPAVESVEAPADSTDTSAEDSVQAADSETSVEESAPEPEESKQETADEQEESSTDETPEIKIETAPADYRFPTTNQTRHCFTRYIEYHRCIAAKGDDAPECDKFAKFYRSLCPGEWVEKWNEQRENGTFAGPL